MRHMILQIHITGNCNLRCKHCYMDEYYEELPYSQFKAALQQFDELVFQISELHKEKVVPHLHLTGGEPFLYHDIEGILDLLDFCKDRYILGIMSNGTLLSDALLRRLKTLNISNFQVSLDGIEETHDAIRGTGNYSAVLKALDLLHKYDIPSRVSFTANAANYMQFKEIAVICREHHVKSLWSDRYIPFSHNIGVKPIRKDQMADYISVLREEHENIENIKANLSVENYRALQFCGSSSLPYICGAGDRLITIDEYGNILPCRRLPIICGNIRETTLTDVYFQNEQFKELRLHKTTGKCTICNHRKRCSGGSRCMAYAICGNYNSPDPCCYI